MFPARENYYNLVRSMIIKEFRVLNKILKKSGIVNIHCSVLTKEKEVYVVLIKKLTRKSLSVNIWPRVELSIPAYWVHKIIVDGKASQNAVLHLKFSKIRDFKELIFNTIRETNPISFPANITIYERGDDIILDSVQIDDFGRTHTTQVNTSPAELIREGAFEFNNTCKKCLKTFTTTDPGDQVCKTCRRTEDGRLKW